MILGDYTGWFYAILITTLGIIAVGYAVGLSAYFKFSHGRSESRGVKLELSKDDLSLA